MYVQTFKCPEGASDPVVVESFWSSAKPCTYYDWSKDQLLEGTNTAGCQAKVAATSCESTQLYKLGGEDVVPDQCLGKKGKGYIAQFTPPCATSEQNASSNVNVECTTSSRKAYCGTDGPFCEHGDWVRAYASCAAAATILSVAPLSWGGCAFPAVRCRVAT